MKPASLQGLRTVIYPVADAKRATDWYRQLLGIDPYFDQPYYIGFNVGGFELGLDPNGRPADGFGGPVAYWGVDKMATTWRRALELGATAESEPRDVGEGIQVASLKDPFGNVIGLIENPHFPNVA